MTWTYDLTQLSAGGKDTVRLMIGDVNDGSLTTADALTQLMQDEEINYFLTKRPNVYGAAAECCRALASKFSILATLQAGDSKIAYSDIAKAYAARAQVFESQAANSGSGLPYAGGISESDKQAQVANTDRVQPQFVLGEDTNFIPIAPASSGAISPEQSST